MGKQARVKSHVLWDSCIQSSQLCPVLCVEKRSKTDVLMMNTFRRILISRCEWEIELNPG